MGITSLVSDHLNGLKIQRKWPYFNILEFQGPGPFEILALAGGLLASLAGLLALLES